MSLSRYHFIFGIFLVTLCVAFFLIPKIHATSPFVVDSIGDSNDLVPGDGTCLDGDGGCSLRAAIQEVNNTAGSDPIAINFEIASSGVQTIMATADLPTITRTNVTIDGATEDGSSCGDLWNGVEPAWNVKLDGSLLDASSSSGFSISGENAVIKGFDIESWGQGISGGGTGVTIACNKIFNNVRGIYFIGASTTYGGVNAGDGNWIASSSQAGMFIGTSSVVQGNFIGTNVLGTAANPNEHGMIPIGDNILIGGTVPRARNLISGNLNHGIDGGYSNNMVIQGNYIGVNVSGTVAIPNGARGISVAETNDTWLIGGTSTAARNIISGNGGNGIDVSSGSVAVSIVGNYIGLNASGTALIANYGGGMNDKGINTVIGGTDSGSGNVIAGLTLGTGVVTLSGSSTIFRGNYVGTTADGLTALDNGTQLGITIIGSGITVGGTTSSSANIIGGESVGIELVDFAATGVRNNIIQGNKIGVGADGTTPIPNNYGIGLIGSNVTLNTIGGTEPGAGNFIANSIVAGVSTYDFISAIIGPFNPGDVFGFAGVGNSIVGNSIYHNGGLGIDLVTTTSTIGVTPNDADDSDTGPNNFQNFPILTSATIGGSSMTIVGTVTSTASTTFRIEFFANSTSSPSGYGEGEFYLGSSTITTDSNGSASFSKTLSTTTTPGYWITATLTDDASNTSEFSAFVTSTAAVVPSSITVNSTLDSSDAAAGNGVCNDGSGNCTLRAAIEEANAIGGSDALIIDFEIASSGVQTISPATVLPTLTRANVTIDGTTEDGSSCGDLWGGTEPTWNVKLDGASSSFDGLTSSGGNFVVKGLDVEAFRNGVVASGMSSTTVQCNYLARNGNDGLLFDSAPSSTVGGVNAGDGNVISGNANNGIEALVGSNGVNIFGNFIGTNSTGSVAFGNSKGISTGVVNSVTIGSTIAGSGNLISGNISGVGDGRGQGVSTTGDSSTGLMIQGNYFGTDRSGAAAIPNDNGMSIVGEIDAQIGGTASGTRNIINSFVTGVGTGNATGTVIQGNYFGLNASGTAVITHYITGVYDSAVNTLVGGTTAGAGNVFAGATYDDNSNPGSGVGISNTSVGATIQGNYFGTDPSGNLADTSFANTNGIMIFFGSGATIGGTASSARNVIGNSSGTISGLPLGAGILLISASNNTILGNYIGLGANGSTTLPNHFGILSFGGSASNNIGGVDLGSGNVITNNLEGGIILGNGPPGLGATGSGNVILGNSIYNNQGLGIDLSNESSSFAEAPTPNDADDSDTGPNGLQNFPELASAVTDGSSILISGRATSTPSTTFRIEFFSNSTSSPSGYGEGETYLGASTITTNASGSVSFNKLLSSSVTAGEWITATLTDNASNTSEFSAFVTSTTGVVPTSTIFTVNSDGDGADASTGDGSCDNGSGNCTLRAAIEEANATAGTSSIAINFEIASSGLQTITLGSALQNITRSNIAIDGTTEDGSSCGNLWGGVAPVWNIKIADDGSTTYSGLNIQANSTTIKGLWITGFDNGADNGKSGIETTADNTTITCNKLDGNGKGVQLSGQNDVIGGSGVDEGNLILDNREQGINLFPSGAASTTIQGNFISVDASGTTLQSDGGGSIRTFGASSTMIRHNLITQGIQLGDAAPDNTTATTNTTVVGNYIGTDITGTQVLNSGSAGVLIKHAVGTVVGTSNLVDRNIIATNGDNGVDLNDGSSGSVVRGNYIGVTPNGDALIAGVNMFSGVVANDGIVGGSNSGEGNVIAGATFGILSGSNAVVKGNYIGTNASGTSPLGNYIGVALIGASSTLGGSNASDRNVIGSSTMGIAITNAFGGGVGNLVEGNYIGLGADGVTPLPNTYGIVLNGSGVVNNTIGGISAGQGNTITNSTNAGITTHDTLSALFLVLFSTDLGLGPAGTGNAFLGNKIYNNDGLGIDLTNTVGTSTTEGPTPNDSLGHTGPNNFQNFPILTSATIASSSMVVEGSISSTPSVLHHIEFFANSTSSPDGYGEGEIYLGSSSIMTNSSGGASFSVTLSTTTTVGYWITATLTDNASNTSEFSAFVTSTAATTTPTPTSSTPSGGGTGGGVSVGGGGGGGGNYTPPVSTATSTLSIAPSSSPSYTDLQTQIDVLLAQLRALILQAQNRGVNLTPQLRPYAICVATPEFSRNLTIGSCGEDVRHLQQLLGKALTGKAAQALKDHGYTNFFYILTKNALKEYQAFVGIIPASGNFGPLTREYLKQKGE